jgi:hypothetical protein
MIIYTTALSDTANPTVVATAIPRNKRGIIDTTVKVREG